MKAYFYSDKPQEAITFFEKTSGKQPKNTLYYRAVSYLGGIYARTGKSAKANYCYSLVFDKCPELQVVAAFCFSPQENKDWNEVMQMTQSNEEKVALWAIRGYYNDEENAIRNIYALNPKSDYLELLLSRLVNHLELKTNKTNNQLFPDEQIVNLDTLHKSTLDLIRSIADAKVCKKPYLWDISAGYIETMYGNFDKATIYFDNAERLMPKTALAQNQLRLLRFVNNLSSMKTLNDKNKASLLADLNWLYSELPNQQSDSFRFHNAVSWSKIMISELFKKQNDAVFAELFSSNVAFYDNKENLTAMKRFLLKTNKNAFEQLAIKIYQLTLEDINQFEAVVATFENHIDKAIALVQNTDDFKNRTLGGNPFSGKIKDCNDCDHANEQKKYYTILDFLKTIRKMQNEVAAGKDVYLNNLLLGNAFYNITFFGNARAFYEGQIMSSSSYLENFPEEKRNLISDCSKPNYYYQKAFEAATNDEQKAKCQYLLAKCERNEYYNGKIVFENNYWTTKYDQIDFRAWDGFVTLNKQYSKTKFYQEVLAECGYFKTYLFSIKQD